MKHLLQTALSPNTELDDIQLAWKTLRDKTHYQIGPSLDLLHKKISTYFQRDSIWLVNSGRSALYLLLNSLELQSTDEVLLQAYTCNAVPNPVLWVGAQPRYVDIDPTTLTMSPAALTAAITPRSKVVIIQHTFGQAADLTALLAIARAHHLIVIEDCAHALGTRYHQQLVGTFGDAAIFSFGRDKVISSVYGGFALVNNPQLQSAVAAQYKNLPHPTTTWIKQQLWHPIILHWAKISWYWLGLGRILMTIAKRLHWISLAVIPTEKQGGRPDYFPARLPAALATLAVHQFSKLDRLNAHRQMIAQTYHDRLQPNTVMKLEESIWLRYTLQVADPRHIWQDLQRQGIVLGDWYWQVIAPAGSNENIMQYRTGQCPVAETAALHSLNLPTHIGISRIQAERLAEQLIKHYGI